MSRIYNKAAKVYIWLGEEDSVSKIAIDFVVSFDEQRIRWYGPWQDNYGFTALSQLLENRGSNVAGFSKKLPLPGNL
jgi:hypothetical protein